MMWLEGWERRLIEVAITYPDPADWLTASGHSGIATTVMVGEIFADLEDPVALSAEAGYGGA